VIVTDRWRSDEPACVYPPAKAGHMAKRRVGVEYSLSMLEPVRPKAVSPDRALCLPTFSHFVIVNITSRTHRFFVSRAYEVPNNLSLSGALKLGCATLSTFEESFIFKSKEPDKSVLQSQLQSIKLGVWNV
jgi:hypothetical protein